MADMEGRWVDVAAVADLDPRGRHVCELDGRSVLLCRTGGEVVAVSNSCTHLGQPLDKGRIMGGRIFCPHHSACFDLRTGEAESGPAVTRLPCYPVRMEEGRVLVRMDEPAASSGRPGGSPQTGEAPSVGDLHPVRVEPAGIVIDVPAGEPVMAAARRQGYRWPNVCGGEAMCGVCMVKVQEGAEHTPPQEEKETFRLKFVGRGRDDTARLACQLTVSGPVTVFRRGVKKEATETIATTDDV